ncbi:MAG: trypsin-like peptidase domain-containing protein [Planctomycetota bacterium]
MRRCRAALLATALAIPIAACRAPTEDPAKASAHRDLRSQSAPPRDPRRTAAVEVFEAARDSVVKFTATRKEQKTDDAGKTTTVTHTQWGSGVIIHPAGYVLTNAHMLRFIGDRRAETFDGTRHPCRLIAQDDRNDLALMKIETQKTFRPMPFARSADALVGEPVLTIGSPFGIRFTLATGIVSGLDRSTQTEHAHLHGLIQTTAPINPGTSGGPLLDIRGRLLGICVSAKRDAENIGFVIPTDPIRKALPDIIAPSQRYGYTLGLDVEPCGPALVGAVEPSSPAAEAGLQPGDLITHISGQPIRFALDVALALIGRKGGQSLDIRIVRHHETRTLRVTLGTVPRRAPDPVGDLAKGLQLEAYRGRWHALPDLSELEPAATGTMATVGLGDWAGKDGFALDLRGYLKVPHDGVYVFHLTSDDGSRLWIGDRVVVDNDGLHPAQSRRGFIPLRAGHHRLRVACFELAGDEALGLDWAPPGQPRAPVPAAALWHAVPAAAPDS